MWGGDEGSRRVRRQWEVAYNQAQIGAKEVFERAISSTMIEDLMADAPRRRRYGAKFLKRLT